MVDLFFTEMDKTERLRYGRMLWASFKLKPTPTPRASPMAQLQKLK